MTDAKFMRLALAEARKSLKDGNYPVGAVLVTEGKVIGTCGNCVQNKKDWISHAELAVLQKNSSIVKSLVKKKISVTLYTTLEPCLLCLGASVLHRVSRIVYACPDPHGGATKVDPAPLSDWYHRKWPQIDKGPYGKESYALLVAFMRKHPENWSKVLVEFERMQDYPV